MWKVSASVPEKIAVFAPLGAPSRVEVIRNDGDFSDSNRVREVGVDRPEKAKGRQRVIEDERNYLSDSVNARIGATRRKNGNPGTTAGGSDRCFDRFLDGSPVGLDLPSRKGRPVVPYNSGVTNHERFLSAHSARTIPSATPRRAKLSLFFQQSGFIRVRPLPPL